MKNKRTHKNKGGEITKNNIFANILSIGYELETTSLIKFSLIDGVMLNTDTNAKLIGAIHNPEEAGEEDMLEVRVQEYNEEDVGEDSSFLITSDIPSRAIIKRISQKCDADKKGTQYSNEERNELFSIEIDDKVTEEVIFYPINFLFTTDQNCYTFSDVEWIATFYKIEKSKNIILNSFLKCINLLLKHLSDLTTLPNHRCFIIDNKDNSSLKSNCILYNKPNTNLYYLQHSPIEKTIDESVVVIQMTFTAYLKDIHPIIKELLVNIPERNDKLNILLSVEKCVENLIERFNEVEPKYKIESENNENIIEIKTLISLILFKIHIYLNDFLIDESRTYLKDKLSMNIRHGNYTLYKELKECLMNLYYENGIEVNEEIVIDIVKKLIVNEEVLSRDFASKENIRKNAFKLTNRLEISNKKYGDPRYSFISYFEYMENPKLDDSIEDVSEFGDFDGRTDWLENNKIDSFSTKMDIHDKIIFIEVRAFPTLLLNYFSKYQAFSENYITIGLLKEFSEKMRVKKSFKRELRRTKRASIRASMRKKSSSASV
uniref:Uncharacterized protein n=1 Tax=viral metagenome TaxID=1070528 RepID=A0A6C0HYR6_9ZZZZ